MQNEAKTKESKRVRPTIESLHWKVRRELQKL